MPMMVNNDSFTQQVTASGNTYSVLKADQVSFGYPGKSPLYSDFSLEVHSDERVALQAPSGWGKTTLCRLLAGYEQPQRGQILLNNKPLPRKGASPVQLILQHPELALDPRMRMEQSLKEAGEPTSDLLDLLGIQQRWLTRFPHELSGGELQRFCIARAIMAQPRFLIADEISTMLDALTQAQIWQALLTLVEERGIGLIFVSHSPALTSRLATRVVKLGEKAACN